MKDVVAITAYDTDKEQMKKIINSILDGDFYDHSGLIYGFGHAVYTLSDPRAVILKDMCRSLAEEKGWEAQYNFYVEFEKTVKEVLAERGKKVLPTNVDFYSGLAYSMLDIPEDLYTPLFAIARVAGWVSHNIENKLYDGRIMRPATKYVGDINDYEKMKDRD